MERITRWPLQGVVLNVCRWESKGAFSLPGGALLRRCQDRGDCRAVGERWVTPCQVWVCGYKSLLISLIKKKILPRAISGPLT